MPEFTDSCLAVLFKFTKRTSVANLTVRTQRTRHSITDPQKKKDKKKKTYLTQIKRSSNSHDWTSQAQQRTQYTLSAGIRNAAVCFKVPSSPNSTSRNFFTFFFSFFHLSFKEVLFWGGLFLAFFFFYLSPAVSVNACTLSLNSKLRWNSRNTKEWH